MPTYTNQIKLPAKENNFSIEFALQNPGPTDSLPPRQLRSRLRHTDANRRFAYYNNLPSGTYTFQLKATNCKTEVERIYPRL